MISSFDSGDSTCGCSARGDKPDVGFNIKIVRIYDILYEGENTVHFETRNARAEGIQAMSNIAQSIPATDNVNFYTSDADLAFLLHQHLSTQEFERAQPILSRRGEVASQQMDKLAEIANCQGPVLVQY